MFTAVLTRDATYVVGALNRAFHKKYVTQNGFTINLSKIKNKK